MPVAALDSDSSHRQPSGRGQILLNQSLNFLKEKGKLDLIPLGSEGMFCNSFLAFEIWDMGAGSKDENKGQLEECVC